MLLAQFPELFELEGYFYEPRGFKFPRYYIQWMIINFGEDIYSILDEINYMLYI